MLSNKQSLILCAFVVVGFSISGMLDLLDSYLVISILVFAFLAIVINIVLYQINAHKEHENIDK